MWCGVEVRWNPRTRGESLPVATKKKAPALSAALQRRLPGLLVGDVEGRVGELAREGPRVDLMLHRYRWQHDVFDLQAEKTDT